MKLHHLFHVLKVQPQNGYVRVLREEPFVILCEVKPRPVINSKYQKKLNMLEE